MSLTPEEARELLDNYNNEDHDHDCRISYLDTQLLTAIMTGPRATDLADLHTQATTLRIKALDESQPEEKRLDLAHDALALEEKREAIIDELMTQIEAQLDRDLEEGKEKPWAKWPR